ncbi:TPA: tetratricopeptide repeat protein [Candidatus Poribacteria bacterium]|nr:tetratricopeptide repeat protein [Candidatus Poribacteria bacterium]
MRLFIVILCILSFLFTTGCGKDKQIEFGEELLRSGRFVEAKAHFENLIRIQPQNAAAHYQLGRVYYAQEDYQKAVEQYRRALGIQPQNPEIQIALGEALLFDGQRSEALRIFLQALQYAGKERRVKKQHVLKIAGLVGDAFHVSQLTRTGVDDCFPSFSPDGRYIAFTSYRDENGEIYIMNADGAEQKRVTTQPQKNDYCPSFSADGEKILFASSDDRLSQASIMLQADGSDTRSELFYLIDINGKQMVPLMNNPTTIGNPVFSPDGRQIAFDFNAEVNLDVYLMDADGKNRRRITTNPADDGQPAFSPDGKSIAFVSRRDDNYELYLMDVDGSNQRRLTYTPWDEYDPVSSPDGKKLAYVSAKGHDLELMLLDLKTRESLQLTNTPGANINPAFSPDGKLTFASDRTDYLEIYLMDLRRPVSQTKLIARIKKMIYRKE